jgi:hypothetical protein
MTIIPWLTQAGKYPVEKIGGIPHFNQAVDLTAPRAGVLHTTEGSWAGSLAVFQQRFAPHFMLGYDDAQMKVRIVQLVQLGTIGAALVTHNWLAIAQIEMIGYSKETIWDPDNETLQALASLMAALKDEYGIPLTRAWPDGVYGRANADDPHRNHGEFGKVAGWFGHGDVPSPDSHWDPGDLAWDPIFKAALAIEAGKQPIPSSVSRPCGPAVSLDEDLLYAVMHADAATKAVILSNLKGS